MSDKCLGRLITKEETHQSKNDTSEDIWVKIETSPSAPDGTALKKNHIYWYGGHTAGFPCGIMDGCYSCLASPTYSSPRRALGIQTTQLTAWHTAHAQRWNLSQGELSPFDLPINDEQMLLHSCVRINTEQMLPSAPQRTRLGLQIKFARLQMWAHSTHSGDAVLLPAGAENGAFGGWGVGGSAGPLPSGFELDIARVWIWLWCAFVSWLFHISFMFLGFISSNLTIVADLWFAVGKKSIRIRCITWRRFCLQSASWHRNCDDMMM